MACGATLKWAAMVESSTTNPLPSGSNANDPVPLRSSQNRFPSRFTRIEPCSNISGEGDIHVMSSDLTTGLSQLAGTRCTKAASSLHSHRQVGRRLTTPGFGASGNRSWGPKVTSMPLVAAPNAMARRCPSPEACGLMGEAAAASGGRNSRRISAFPLKSPAARTTPPFARTSRDLPPTSTRTATTRPSSLINSVLPAPVRTPTPSLRAAFSSRVMYAWELGMTLCIRGQRCGGSRYGPTNATPSDSSQWSVSADSRARSSRVWGASPVRRSGSNFTMSSAYSSARSWIPSRNWNRVPEALNDPTDSIVEPPMRSCFSSTRTLAPLLGGRHGRRQTGTTTPDDHDIDKLGSVRHCRSFLLRPARVHGDGVLGRTSLSVRILRLRSGGNVGRATAPRSTSPSTSSPSYPASSRSSR